MLELRGNSRITGGSGGPQSMAARDIDLTYGPDGKTLQFAKLIEGAVLQLPGTGPGAAGKRIAGDTIDMALAPDGSTVTNLNSNGARAGGSPGGKRRPGQTHQVGDHDCGGRSGRRPAERAVRWWRRVLRDTRCEQVRPGCRSDRTVAKLSVDTKPGLGALEKADFRGNVIFTDGPDFKAEGQRGEYYIAANRLDLTLADGRARPGSERQRPQDLGLGAQDQLRTIDARHDGGHERPQHDHPAEDRQQAGPQTRIPSMLAQDQPVNVTSNRLVYTAAGATYTGNATLWQDKTTIKGRQS